MAAMFSTLLRGALALTAWTAVAVPPLAAADADTMTPDVVPVSDRQCTAQERADSLTADQQRVLNRLGHLRTLNGPDDVMQLAALGAWGPDSHGWVQYRDVGVGLLNLPRSLDIIARGIDGVTAGTTARDTVVSGEPTGLFYRSLNPNPGYDDAYTPSFPYELVGWFYGAVYTPGITPIENGLCVYPTDWGFHERGVHAFPNFDMVMQPPAEPWMGADPGTIPLALPNPPGLVHPRAWDLHIWLVPGEDTPITGALDTAQTIAGHDGGIPESFPYPQGPTAVGPDLPEHHGH
ncbi:hypothetical protein [Nocardia sp. alder85J]|uniref:hypothetical protein n=1 Tax=Nocardia sp. alder85J TaxID=2862949 RepID=UPI001CD40786|nr:hypothetical protein [Nocardia sp. alder85J]MCX4098274.1 hypothetical protein [Nocardia sp. alder85J]